MNKYWGFVISLMLLLLGAMVGTNSTFAQVDDAGITIAAEDLATAVSNASPGDIINVKGGTFYGSLDIDTPITLNGIDWPVVDGENEGTVITINAPGTTIRGFGIGLKDMDDAQIRNNLILDNRVGIHLDTTPREVDSTAEYSGNVFAYNDIGVQMMPSIRNNHFTDNSFVENEEQVAVAGGGIIKDNLWTIEERGNYWSDYAGYDAATDGLGDIPYKSERLFENLMAQEPELRLFIHSPAVNAIDFAAKAFPLVRPQPKLEDTQPLMTPIVPENVPALPQPSRLGGIWSGLILILLAVAIVLLPKMRLQFTNNGFK